MLQPALVLAALLCWSALVTAQPFPVGGQPVTIVNPYPPGGMGDVLSRLMGAKMQDSLGVPVIVENKPGANGGIGTGYVARSKPDGHTLAIVPMSTVTINPWLYRDLQYQPKDLTPVMNAISLPNVLVVHPSVPANNLQELIDLVKREPDKLNYASMGQGSSGHMLAELFRSYAHAQIAHIPYKGSGPALQDLLGGKVQIMFENLPNVLGQIRAGKLRALGVTSAASSPQAPEIPPISSVIPGFEATIWIGYVAPAGLPRETLARLNEHLVRAIRQPDVTKAMEDRGAAVLASTPEEFSKTVASDYDKWGKVVKEANITIQ
jgi:tripartite-type tricarboxylate transporter receptor subunit TctC